MSEYLDKLLKRLQVHNYKKVGHDWLYGNYNFFNRNVEMIGGGGDDEIIKYTYVFKKQKFKFNVHVVKEYDRISHKVYNYDNLNKNECIIIFYDVAGKFCYLESINSLEKCCIGQIYGPGGSILLKFTLDFIKQYIAKKYKVKFIQLKDNSKKKCDLIDVTVHLSAFYMFTHADTWYGKYGFVPFDPDEEKTYQPVLEDYKHNQKIVLTTLVKDTSIGKYIVEAIKKYKLKIDVDAISNVVKKYDNLPIMHCINNLMAKYDKHCVIFYYMYSKLMSDLGMRSLYGRTYWLKL